MSDKPIASASQQDLIPQPRSDVIVLNGRCTVFEEEGLRVVMVSGTPVYRYLRLSTTYRPETSNSRLAPG